VKLEISKRARRQIERIQAWWVKERPAARSLFLDEMAAAERQLFATPELGSIYTEHKTGTIRRVLLPRTHHQLDGIAAARRVLAAELHHRHSRHGTCVPRG